MYIYLFILLYRRRNRKKMYFFFEVIRFFCSSLQTETCNFILYFAHTYVRRRFITMNVWNRPVTGEEKIHNLPRDISFYAIYFFRHVSFPLEDHTPFVITKSTILTNPLMHISIFGWKTRNYIRQKRIHFI